MGRLMRRRRSRGVDDFGYLFVVLLVLGLGVALLKFLVSILPFLLIGGLVTVAIVSYRRRPQRRLERPPAAPPQIGYIRRWHGTRRYHELRAHDEWDREFRRLQRRHDA